MALEAGDNFLGEAAFCLSQMLQPVVAGATHEIPRFFTAILPTLSVRNFF